MDACIFCCKLLCCSWFCWANFCALDRALSSYRTYPVAGTQLRWIAQQHWASCMDIAKHVPKPGSTWTAASLGKALRKSAGSWYVFMLTVPSGTYSNYHTWHIEAAAWTCRACMAKRTRRSWRCQFCPGAPCHRPPNSAWAEQYGYALCFRLVCRLKIDTSALLPAGLPWRSVISHPSWVLASQCPVHQQFVGLPRAQLEIIVSTDIILALPSIERHL